VEKDKIDKAMHIGHEAFDFDFDIDTNTFLDYFENLDNKYIILELDICYIDNLAFAYKSKKTIDY